MLLGRSRVLVACDAEDEDEILGYAVGEPGDDTGPAAVHWVYVRLDMRRKGVAKKMFEDIAEGAAGVCITAVTKGWIRQLANVKGWSVAEFAPFYAAISDGIKESA